MEEFLLFSLPLDLLGDISRYLSASDVINVKYSCRLLKSKMSRGGMASYIIANFENAPISPTWLLPVFHSRLTELRVTCKTKPYLKFGMMTQLPSSLRCISLNFENSMAFLEALPVTPGVTHTLQESYKMMNMDDYFPNLTDLTLVDKSLAWKTSDNNMHFLPSSDQLSTFVSRLPRCLLHLSLAPYPSLDGRVSELPNLISFHLHYTPNLTDLCIPTSLTSLRLSSASYPPPIDFATLTSLDELIYDVPASVDTTWPSNIKKIEFKAGFLPSSLALPQGLCAAYFGHAESPESLLSLLPGQLQHLHMDTAAAFDLTKLPPSLTEFCVGSVTVHRHRLGFATQQLKDLPSTLVSLTLIGRHRITHECWFFLPKSLKILKMPDLTVNSAFVKLVPHNMVEIVIGVLQFTFKEGLALIEEQTELYIPKSLETALLAKLLPKHLIFILNRSECDLRDMHATILPLNLYSLYVQGSHPTITDYFVAHLPRSLRVLRMPHQSTFTSQVLSFLPTNLHTLELEGSGLPTNLALPPSITTVCFACSEDHIESKRKLANKLPKGLL